VHGRREEAYAAIWSRDDHLLLAAFVFPLVAKLRLREMGLYELTTYDEDKLHAIDFLIAAKDLRNGRKDEYEMPIYGFVEALDAANEIRRRARTIAAIEKAWQQQGGGT
jgi:hypothetical protein